MVDCYWKFVASNISWTVTRSIPFENGEFLDNGFAFAVKNAMCTQANCKASNCTVELAQGSATGTKAYPPTASRL